MTIPQTNRVDPLPALAASAAVEVIPLKNAEERLRDAPPGSTVTVTCSPKTGVDRTLEVSAHAARTGHHVVPHLAARQVGGRPHLREIIARLADDGIRDLFVIGGDASAQDGGYRDATELLDDLAGMDHGLDRIGVGCYPEGHPKIPAPALLESLLRKQVHAHYMVSQLCFDSAALTGWLRETRASGVILPLRVGVSAPLSTRKLIELSLRIGVGSSVRFLSKQHGMVGNLLLGGTYRPEELLDGMRDELSDPALAIEGLHLFSFNQVQAAVAWQQRMADRS